MAKNHGNSVKNDKQYEGLRKKGMSKQRAASIANSRGLLQPRREEERQGQRRQQVAEARRRTRGRQEVGLEVLTQRNHCMAGDSRRSMRSSPASSIGL